MCQWLVDKIYLKKGAIPRPSRPSTLRSRRSERGQGMVEYILILAVIVSIFVLIVRPFFKTFQEKIGDNFKNGSVFSEDANFYYFPVRRN